MIVVVGSRHDPVAISLAEAWPDAGLLSAEDLTTPGWKWTSSDGAEQWVIGGRTVADAEISGIFVRRSTLLPEELPHIHPDDRAYLAAEARAFLIAMLGATRARVINPVGDGALGEELLRPEQWLAAAAAAGLDARPLSVNSERPREPSGVSSKVEVVGAQAFGDAPESRRNAAIELASALSLGFACCLFDSQGRLIALALCAAPSAAASAALAELLTGPRP